MGNLYHRPNGQFGTKFEAAALAAGVARGIAIGVAMAAKAMAIPLQILWSMIRSGRGSRRNAG
jgi:hypothetical protein